MRNPLLAAVGASVGSVVVMGATTMLVASTALGVIQTVAKQHKVRTLFDLDGGLGAVGIL